MALALAAPNAAAVGPPRTVAPAAITPPLTNRSRRLRPISSSSSTSSDSLMSLSFLLRSRRLVDHAPDALLMSEPDRLPLTEGAVTRLREDERGEPVLSCHLRRPLLANRRREALELDCIRLRKALREVGDPVDRRAPGCQPEVVDPPVVSDAHRRTRAQHLRRALVAVARDPALVDHAQRPVLEPQGDHGVVDVAQLGKGRIRQRRSDRRHLLDLTDEPAGRVQLVDRHVDEEPTRLSEVLQGWRLLVSQPRVEEVDLAELSGPDALGGCGPVGIEPAVEADLQRDSRLADRVDRGNRDFEAERDRLLAEDVLAGCRRRLDHLHMQRRRRRDDDTLDIEIAQQVLEGG